MKRALITALLTALLVLPMATAASAHVHGITPLSCPGVGNGNSGVVAAEGTPAWATNGGPLTGLIPRDTGKAPLTIGDGGFKPANNPHCAP